MKAQEKRDLLYALTDAYVSEKEKNKVWGRESSESYFIAKGKLIGACMAFEVDVKETDNGVWLYSRKGRYILHIWKSDDGGAE